MLLGELRNRLKNDMVQLSIELNKGQATATSLTDSEFYSVFAQKMSLSQHHDSGHAHHSDIRQKEAHKILNCTPGVKFRSAVQILSADK